MNEDLENVVVADDGVEDANVNLDDNITTEHQSIDPSDQKIEVPTMKVAPLKKICMTIGEIPTSYLETMSYYEMLVWFIHFLRDTVIPTVNNNSEAVQEVQTIVMSLQNYINTYKETIDQEIESFESAVNEDIQELENYMNDYFNNLDVQDEINNKLDQMLEDGVLEQIIEQFLQSTAVWCFDTVNDMKTATNLVNGSYAKTLGYYAKNDGGMSNYKIRTKTNADVINESTIIALNDNELIAELIISDELNSRQLGVYGDKTHDDTLKLQAALNLNKKITLIGEIKVTNKITIDVGLHEGIKGLNNTKILGDFSTNGFSIFELNNSLYDDSQSGIYGNVARFVLDNLYFSNITELDETDVTHSGNCVELKDGCNNINFVNCTFTNTVNGIYTSNTASGVYSNKFTSCYFRHNDYGVYIGCVASNDCGENFRFINCSLSTSKLGNFINNDMYVNFIGCSFDYNLGNTFIIQDCAVVSVSNSHIEWYASTPLINIYNNGSLKFDNSLFLKTNYDDGGNAEYFITSSVTASVPEIIFNACTFKMYRTYANLANNGSVFVKFVDCNRNEYTPTNFITNKFYTLDLTQCVGYEYPLNYDSGLTRNSTKVKVTCNTVKTGNFLMLPILDENRDFKITLTVVSSIDMDITIDYGVGNVFGTGMVYSTGVLSQNESLTANTNKTITIVYKSRRGLSTKPFIKFKVGNLTQGATFEVLNMATQVI